MGIAFCTLKTTTAVPHLTADVTACLRVQHSTNNDTLCERVWCDD